MSLFATELAEAISAVTAQPAAEIEKMLAKTKRREHGDLAYPAFEWAKSVGIPPPAAAAKLVSEIQLPSGVAAVEQMGPYANFRFDRVDFANAAVAPKPVPSGRETIILEYSSPNIAKPFHVGHLRTTMIGHSLAQTMKARGFNVIQVNHLGDWGTQFGFVFAGCELFGQPEPSVDGLVEVYGRASALRKEQDAGGRKEFPDVNQMAREYFVRLEAGDPDARKFWEWCLEISLTYLKSAYARLGITFDHYTGESFFESHLPEVEATLRQSGLLIEDNGAWGVDLGEELGFARVYAEDGRSLYLTRDLAAATYREREYAPNRILYVVSNQQTLHFRQLRAILEKLGHPVAPKIIHVPFGYVPGMSTRGGENISLANFLTEAKSRAAEAYEQVRRAEDDDSELDEITEKVAIGSAFFYFLNHSNNKDFQFSWKEALNFQGDTGPYVQYAVARINSIFDKVEIAPVFAAEHLTDDASFEMLQLISEMDDAAEAACADYEPLHLANHVLALARAFMKGYQSLRVVGAEPEVAAARLALFGRVRESLEQGMVQLGVPVIRRM